MGALGSESHSLVLSQVLRRRSMAMNDVNTHTHAQQARGAGVGATELRRASPAGGT